MQIFGNRSLLTRSTIYTPMDLIYVPSSNFFISKHTAQSV